LRRAPAEPARLGGDLRRAQENPPTRARAAQDLVSIALNALNWDKQAKNALNWDKQAKEANHADQR
jgi:hypothetical protein